MLAVSLAPLTVPAASAGVLSAGSRFGLPVGSTTLKSSALVDRTSSTAVDATTEQVVRVGIVPDAARASDWDRPATTSTKAKRMVQPSDAEAALLLHLASATSDPITAIPMMASDPRASGGDLLLAVTRISAAQGMGAPTDESPAEVAPGIERPESLAGMASVSTPPFSQGQQSPASLGARIDLEDSKLATTLVAAGSPWIEPPFLSGVFRPPRDRA